MTKYDPEMAKRVWSRVQSTPATESGGSIPLAELLAYAQSTANLCQHLAGQLQGSAGMTMRQMAAQARRHVHCLQGICALENGACPQTQRQSIPKEAPAAALHRCYQQTVQNAARYEKLSSDPNYGHTYGAMAAREYEHSQQLLVLIGMQNSRK